MSTPEFLTTGEVADLLRLKSRKVYSLAARGVLPCRKVTGRLLFPRSDIEALIAGAGVVPDRNHAAAALPEPPPVVGGSHDPLLAWAIREADCGLATLFEGSGAGIGRVLERRAVAAGLHLPEADGHNVRTVAARVAAHPVPRGLVLLEWARRRIGVMARAGTGIGGVRGLAGRRLVARQAGSGGAARAAELLAGAGLGTGVGAGAVEMLERPARTEDEAALAVAQGRADAAIGIEAVARQHGLAFTAEAEERFDLLIDRRHVFEPPLQRLLAFARGAALVAEARALGGYDVSGLGTVHWNAPE